ncbi:hypothetical protein [uncultured Helicobacter sp.]|uniref:hypothetical protein n=1 Tax=uncultured Helicobacter sp. TaxID=175537 RepID=UPI00374E6021
MGLEILGFVKSLKTFWNLLAQSLAKPSKEPWHREILSLPHCRLVCLSFAYLWSRYEATLKASKSITGIDS